MVQKLRDNPEVVGLLEYGSARCADETILGDYDLIAILKDKDPSVHGLHFYVGGVPVDLNLFTLDEIRELPSDADTFRFDSILVRARIIHDPTELVAQEIHDLKERLKGIPAKTPITDSFAETRFGTKHIFDKIKGRFESMPTLCAHLLHGNVYWLVQHYFHARGLDYKGEKHALEYLREHEGETYSYIEEFYATADLTRKAELCERIAEVVLRPVGGMWRDDEVITFGDQEKGRQMFQSLLGKQECCSEEEE